MTKAIEVDKLLIYSGSGIYAITKKKNVSLSHLLLGWFSFRLRELLIRSGIYKNQTRAEPVILDILKVTELDCGATESSIERILKNNIVLDTHQARMIFENEYRQLVETTRYKRSRIIDNLRQCLNVKFVRQYHYKKLGVIR